MDTDIFVLSVITKEFVKDLKKVEDCLDFSNLSENHELLKKTNYWKIQDRNSCEKLTWYELICLRSKMYAFKCWNEEMIVKLN